MHPRRYGVPILGLLLLTVCVQGRVSAAAIDVLGVFEDYLKIVLRCGRTLRGPSPRSSSFWAALT